MTIRVLAFARLREVLAFGERELWLTAPATVRDAWVALAEGRGPADALFVSTRFARNGALVAADSALADGDELALLPPVGGG